MLSQLCVQPNSDIQIWQSEQGSYNIAIDLVRQNMFNLEQFRLLTRSFVENQGRRISKLQDMFVEVRLEYEYQPFDMEHLGNIHGSLLRAYRSLKAAFEYDHSKFENYISESAIVLRAQRKRVAELELAYASLVNEVKGYNSIVFHTKHRYATRIYRTAFILCMICPV